MDLTREKLVTQTEVTVSSSAGTKHTYTRTYKHIN
jgi:hypothetical protein